MLPLWHCGVVKNASVQLSGCVCSRMCVFVPVLVSYAHAQDALRE